MAQSTSRCLPTPEIFCIHWLHPLCETLTSTNTYKWKLTHLKHVHKHMRNIGYLFVTFLLYELSYPMNMRKSRTGTIIRFLTFPSSTCIKGLHPSELKTGRNWQKLNIEWQTALVESERRGEIDQNVFGERGAFWKPASYERSWRQEYLNQPRVSVHKHWPRGQRSERDRRATMMILFNDKCQTFFIAYKHQLTFETNTSLWFQTRWREVCPGWTELKCPEQASITKLLLSK